MTTLPDFGKLTFLLWENYVSVNDPAKRGPFVFYVYCDESGKFEFDNIAGEEERKQRRRRLIMRVLLYYGSALFTALLAWRIWR